MDDLISRQSAIDELVKMLRDCFCADEEVLDAVETTLKELPPIQTEKHTETHACDSISRQAAIDVIDKIFPVDPMRNDYTQGITCGAALATEYIKQLPSAEPEYDLDGYSSRLWKAAYERGKQDAEPERKKGRWAKPKNQISSSLNEWICSNCNYLISGKHNFCPNCGADMRGEQDGRFNQQTGGD